MVHSGAIASTIVIHTSLCPRDTDRDASQGGSIYSDGGQRFRHRYSRYVALTSAKFTVRSQSVENISATMRVHINKRMCGRSRPALVTVSKLHGTKCWLPSIVVMVVEHRRLLAVHPAP